MGVFYSLNMAVYRNGTYIAFHAEGSNLPTQSDIKYYNLIKAWSAKKEDDFTFVNSHEKTSALRTSSSKTTLKNRLSERLRNHSKNLLLIVGETTKDDKDWVPFEIEYAVDTCEIPIIIAYTGYKSILNPKSHKLEWPDSLSERIESKTARCIHIPFKKEAIKAAIDQFDFSTPPSGSYNYYSKETYIKWGIISQ